MKKIKNVILAVALTFASVLSAQALQIDYNKVLTGGTPAGDPPWLTAIFSDTIQDVGGTNYNGVLLKVSAVGLEDSEFLTKMNFNNTLTDTIGFSSMKYVNNSPTVATVISFGASSNAYNGNPGGANNKFDIEFSFQTSNSASGADRLIESEIAQLFFYDVSGLNAETFNSLSYGTQGGLISEAHMQGINAAAPNDSSWIGPGGATPVPEPGTIILLGAGLLGLAAYGRKKIQK